jgi:hypothetical protein
MGDGDGTTGLGLELGDGLGDGVGLGVGLSNGLGNGLGLGAELGLGLRVPGGSSLVAGAGDAAGSSKTASSIH